MGRKYETYADWCVRESFMDYAFYVNSYKRKLLNMFTWKNLPDGISSRFIETNLFYNGILVLFRDPKLGFLKVTRCTPIMLNDYDEPIYYWCYSNNKSNAVKIKASDCVPLWNDNLIEGDYPSVRFFSKKLDSIEKTIRVNMEQLKNPTLISCPESQKLSVEKVMAQKEEGKPWIIVDEDYKNLNKTQVFDMHIKNYVQDLEDEKERVISQSHNYFGIDNVNIRKKERLTEAEGKCNNEEININKGAKYITRLDFCKRANEMFNTNIQVEFSNKLIQEALMKGGENDGSNNNDSL